MPLTLATPAIPEQDMPSAAPSFLLLRFLCRHKENEVAVGQPRRFFFKL
jgi:hypothetical protein